MRIVRTTLKFIESCPDILYNPDNLNKMEEIFNKGKAGIVEVKIISVLKEPNDGFRRIIFCDSEGRILEHAYNYLHENEPGYQKKLKAMGIQLRHFWEVIVGEEPIPVFGSPEQMLDTIIDEIFKKSKGKKFRISVNYGYPPKHYIHLILNKFTPFIEDASIQLSSLYLSAKAYYN